MAVGEHRALRRSERAVFALKSALLKLRRAGADAITPVRQWPRQLEWPHTIPLAEVITPLYTESDPAERALQLGKVQNLRVAARRLDGIVVPAGAVFSFWAHIGWPSRAKGYVEGRELRQGCLIPTVAGGLCQLSNSLYRVSRDAGCEIVERHGHTAAIPNSPFPAGEDATVYWNYVDLRFRCRRDTRLRVRLDADTLRVALEGRP